MLIICLIFIAIEFELIFQEFFYSFQAILLHKNKNPPYFFQNFNLDEMKILLYNMGMEIVKKNWQHLYLYPKEIFA